MFRLLRLPRLFRLTKIVKLTKGGSNSFINNFFELFELNLGVKRILIIFSIMFMISHLSACLYYFTARFRDFDE